MSDQLDLSNIHCSKFSDKDWFGLVVPDDIARLTRLREAILKWGEVTMREFTDYKEQIEGQRKPGWDNYVYDPVQDEAFMLMETGRAMWASLAVSVSSTVERLFSRICKSLGLVLPPKADWGKKKSVIEASLSIDSKTLSGYSEITEARLLANCFKHDGGTASDELVKMLGGRIGEEIEYEGKDWLKIIGGTQSFMSALIDQLPG